MNQKQILCIEDEAAIVLPLRYALEREGWSVSWANTGTQALELLSQQTFDFIILDVGLPDLNGFEVCKQLRQKYQTPLLFLTARDDEIDRVVGLEIGADDYCTKPFSAREIVARIKAIWRRMEVQTQNIHHNHQSFKQKLRYTLPRGYVIHNLYKFNIMGKCCN
jgi:two-component system catabolic regulation response regulator CreB